MKLIFVWLLAIVFLIDRVLRAIRSSFNRGAVSYTHLDVYKRQHLRHPARAYARRAPSAQPHGLMLISNKAQCNE